MKKKIGRMWIGAITVALIALIAVWTELSGTERFGINSSGYQAGVAAYEDGDYATAIEKLQPFAEQGHAEAQYYFGLMYYYGRGVDEDDKVAVKWFRKAAEQGHAEAQDYLGSMYYLGQGVDEDEKEAAKWFHKAAEQGHTEAQFNLGYMYYYGRGVDEDDKVAVKWFHKAAEQGHAEAQDYVDQIEAIGKKASDFTLQTLTDERFNLAEQHGRPIFLNFWATWCPPCLAEMPDMQKLQQTLGDSILIVGIDNESADTVREFVQDRGYTWTFVLDPDNEVARTYDVSGIPTSVFIDAKGVIVRQFVGQQDYETFLEAAREAIGN